MIVVRVPGVNGLGKTSGTREAGREILKDLGERHEEIHVDNNNLEEQESLIYKNSKKLFDEEERVVFVGGDHSISYSTVRAFVEKYGDDVRLVVFDAHADCMPPMKEPTHEEWLRALIERGGLEGKQVLLIGSRKIEEEERDFIDKEGIGMSDDVSVVRDFVKSGKIYVSFDVDVFRGVKATGYAEGELSEEEGMELLGVVLGGDVGGCDLVELNLEGDGLGESLRIARGVVGKFISGS